jgi:transketolase
MTVEEHSVHGGLGSAVAEVLAQSPIPAKLSILGMRDFGESGDLGELLEKYGFDAGTIAKKAKEMLGK